MPQHFTFGPSECFWPRSWFTETGQFRNAQVQRKNAHIGLSLLLSPHQTPISQSPFASVHVKRVSVRNHQCENVFPLEVHFHLKGFTQWLALRQRHRVTWQWRIRQVFFTQIPTCWWCWSISRWALTWNFWVLQIRNEETPEPNARRTGSQRWYFLSSSPHRLQIPDQMRR